MQEDFNQLVQTLSEIIPALPFRFGFLACPPWIALVLTFKTFVLGRVRAYTELKPLPLDIVVD
jgi:hypothetical protein